MEIIKKRRVSLSSLSAGNMPAGLESDPRTERKPELFQKDRDRAKNESFAIGLAGRKSHLLPKIGDARKKLFHQDPVPSTDSGVSFLCPLSSSRSSTCASLLGRKQATAFLTTEDSELVPAKPTTGLVPCFYWYHFLNQSPTSLAILLLSLVLASLLKLFLNYRLTLPAVKDQEMALPALSNWYFPYDSDCGLPEIRPILLLLLNQLGLTWLWPLSDRWSMKTLDP